MNQFLKNHQLNKAEIGLTDESFSDWISGLQDTFSSISVSSGQNELGNFNCFNFCSHLIKYKLLKPKNADILEIKAWIKKVYWAKKS